MIYFASKLFKLLFLPPGIFVWILLFLAYRYKSRLAFLSALVLGLLSSSFSTTFLKPLEEWTFPKNPTPPQAVVALGGGIASSDPYLPLAAHATKRLLAATMIAVEKKLPLIVSGCEGAYAKKTLQKLITTLHLPLHECDTLHSGCYLIEVRSTDTYHNALYTKQLFNSPSPSVILVTSASHMPRSYRLFRYSGFHVTPAATDYLTSNVHLSFWEHLPTISNLYNSYIALHEYVGLLSLSLRGIP